MTQYKGKTEDSQSPILKASFWKKGTSVSGVVVREFTTRTGNCWQVRLFKPLRISGQDVSPEISGSVTTEAVSIGRMAGLIMALNAAGLAELKPDDKVMITCIGHSDSGKGNERTDFDVEVDRPDSKA